MKLKTLTDPRERVEVKEKVVFARQGVRKIKDAARELDVTWSVAWEGGKSRWLRE